jgi:DEAD/DEAH box helicase domain-containing protein
MPASEAGLRIAVFTDGFEFHRDRIAKDMLQRQAVWRAGDTLVWSLSWNDVQAALADVPETLAPNPLVERLATTDPTTVGKMGKLFEVDGFAGREQEGAFAWLARWLETPAAGLADKRRKWTRWAMFRAMLHARKADEDLRTALSKAAGGILPPLVAGSAGALGARSLLAACRLPDEPDGPGIRWLVAAGFGAAPDPEALFLALALEQAKGVSAKALLPWWRAFLRLATLAQFLPDAIAVDDRGLAVGAYANLLRGIEAERARPEAAASPPAVGAEAWEALAAELDPDRVAALRAAGVPVPELDDIGLDLVGTDGTVVAQAEIAWPDRRIALVGEPLDPEDLARLEPWSIMTVGEAIGDPRALGAAFVRTPEDVA